MEHRVNQRRSEMEVITRFSLKKNLETLAHGKPVDAVTCSRFYLQTANHY